MKCSRPQPQPAHCSIPAACNHARSLDTGRLNAETYQLFDQVEKHYGIRIEYTFPDAQETMDLVRGRGGGLLDLLDNQQLLYLGVCIIAPCGLHVWDVQLTSLDSITACDPRPLSAPRCAPRACSPSTRTATLSAAGSAKCAWAVGVRAAAAAAAAC